MITNKEPKTVKRQTCQRTKILEYLKSVKSHPNAEQVYLEVKKSLPHISLATVYRNLNQLSEDGEIIKLEIDGEARFDGFSHNHQHFICKDGKIIDIEDDSVVKYALKKLPDNLKADNIQIIYEGRCKR